MNIKDENICRLCLTVAVNDFEIIDEITRHMFEVLLLKANLDISKDPIICKDCKETLIKCFDFKSVCIDTDFAVDRNFEDGKEAEIAGDNFICRFCSNRSTGNNFVSLDTLKKDVSFAEILQAIAPEMNFNVIKNPVICTICRQRLDSYIELVKKCSYVEEKITKYLQNGGVPSSAQVILGEVVRFSFKQEIDASEDTSASYSEVYDGERVKAEEEMDVKEHIVNDNQPTYELNIARKVKAETEISKTPKASTQNFSELQIFQCATCPFQTQIKRELGTHIAIHKDVTTVKTYKCSICTYQTRCKSNLNRHLLIHKAVTEVETYKCSICTFRTKRKDTLKPHALTHQDVTYVEMYKCTMCSFRTKHKGSLKTHKLIHNDVTQMETYKCSMCTYQSNRKGPLKTHMLIHKNITEVETYKCSTCNYRSNRKGNLKAHTLIHKDVSELETYKCWMCAYESRDKYYFKAHVKKHSNLEKGK